MLDRVSKSQYVRVGDTIVTAGSLGAGAAAVDVPARHPDRHGHEPVGQNDTNLFQNIQVQPFVDFSSLQSVLVLVPKKTG